MRTAVAFFLRELEDDVADKVRPMSVRVYHVGPGGRLVPVGSREAREASLSPGRRQALEELRAEASRSKSSRPAQAPPGDQETAQEST